MGKKGGNKGGKKAKKAVDELAELQALRKRCQLLTSAMNNLKLSINITDEKGIEVIKNKTSIENEGKPVVLSTTTTIAHGCKMVVAQTQKNELFSYTMDCLPLHVWIADDKGANEYISNRWTDVTGVDPAGMSGWRWNEAIHPDDLPDLMAKYDHSIKTGEPLSVEFRLMRPDQTYRWLISQGSPVRGSDGNITQWLGIIKLFSFVNV
jgi:PAS domain S-box-containing protein